MRYKIQGAEVDDKGRVDVPDDVSIIGAMYHPATLKLMVVCLSEIKEEETEESTTEEKPKLK